MTPQEAKEVLKDIDGIFTGMLSDGELKALKILQENGEAKTVFEGAAGFLGLSKFRLIERN